MVFFPSREEGGAWDICILDRSLQCGFGKAEPRMGTRNHLEDVMSA